MRIHDLLNEASRLIGNQQRAAESTGNEEEVALWRYLREHWVFAVMTGQVYVFEDYLAGLAPARTSYVSGAFNAHADARSKQAMAMLLRTLDEMEEPERKRQLLILIDLLNFITATDRQEALARYLEDSRSDAPPPVLAFFDTREEADAWLSQLAEPPSYGHVMIGDEYFEIWYSREDGVRELFRDHGMDLFFEDFESKPLPPPAASFNTREEAIEWLASHPVSPTALVTIAGEYYHAAYYKKFNRHTLLALSRLREWRAKRKAEMEQEESAEPEPSEV
ncbi:hypothetical protein [Vitiosangium sp. GDMCC 1.1324]|uniref:hypothetical protein n=1 Tax=Vitiosangium sp. (strain GDMCC 1.1324) TaxID=2138576 RepID=UPI000D3A8068|nr:hypothetical protein [Vitiosangium sp. GDMCC 1.1324]PTL78184.1 hypothetical protein DAT35_39675 [Vitiosangium sp. GDMCC 1.1324]